MKVPVFREHAIGRRFALVFLTFLVAAAHSQPVLGPGALDRSFDPGTGPNGRVNAALVQQDGKVVIAGAFSQVAGVTRTGIARLNADGDLDTTFDPGDGVRPVPPPERPAGLMPITFLAQQADGKILIGGSFNRYDGVECAGAVRVNLNGSLDSTFNPPASVSGLTAFFPNGSIMTRSPLVRLHPDGSLDPSFEVDYSAVGVGPGQERTAGAVTEALPLEDRRLMVILPVSAWWGYAGNRLVRLEADGSADSTFPSPTFSTEALLGQRDILARHINGGILLANQGRLTLYSQDGSVDPRFSSALTGINALAPQSDGKIVVGGYLESPDGAKRLGVARLNPDGSLDPTFDTGTGFGLDKITTPYGGIYNFALQGDGGIIVVGNFSTVDGFERPHIVRLIGGDPPGPPSITLPPASQTAMQGQTVTLSVSVSGRDLDYQWLFEGEPILNAVAPDLILTDVMLSDAGEYSVVASNAFGSVTSSSAVLTVVPLIPPEIETQPENQTVRAGAPAAFFVAASHLLPVTYQWQRDGVELAGATNATYAIPSARSSDAGIYSVTVSSELNSVQSDEARLDVTPPPPRAGAVDPSFYPRGGPANPVLYGAMPVTVLALQPDGKILVAGDFTAFDFTARNRIARLHEDGSLDHGFELQGVLWGGGYFNSPIDAPSTIVRVVKPLRLICV